MALLETLAIELGSSIAKSILKAWLKNPSLASDSASSFVDVFKSWTSDRIAQGRAQRQFEEIGEEVGKNLLPIFEMDRANLDEASCTAVALAVAETLSSASSAVLAQNDLASDQLAKYLLDRPIGTQHFNDTEISLYRRVISASCEYIVHIASQYPTFTEYTFAEMLKREKQLLDITKQTLEEVRRLREEAPQFELEYRLAVVRKLGDLQLFGADVSVASRRHSLSIAYVSLSVERKLLHNPASQIHAYNMTHEKITNSKDEKNRDIVPVETALVDARHLLIRGMPGSGKTTLLQWIAVSSALRSFKGPLAKWNNTLPFYISLRYCTESRLPTPEDFPKFVTTAITDTMPKGWVNNELKSGRAIVLVDGLDEISALQREDVRLWLKDLVEAYPKSRFFVTSRLGAVEEGWMDREGFDDAEFQPMELKDIHEFIDHWHSAVTEELYDEEEKNELPSLAQHLKEEVESSRPIRDLATNPLLCSMLCALNRERREHLPVDRIELYEACCQMLIERRDKERRILLTDYPAKVLTYRERTVLLQDLAYWLINNGWSQIETHLVDERFERKLISIHNLQQKNISGVDVRCLFVERTSIIREPMAGHIDFTHRTFQEFFAAKAALGEGDIGVLIKNAHDYQWREVIILSAGLAPNSICEQLIHGLILRGDKEEGYRYQLHLLAVSCLETTVELGPKLKIEVERRLGQLVPPKNMRDAKTLATAGELAVKHLTKKARLSASTRAACVRALAIIGSDAALDILEGYADDSHDTVISELLKAWDAFNRVAYAQRILSRTLQNKSELRLERLSSIEGLQFANLTNLTKLDLSGCSQLKDITPLNQLINLTELNLSGCSQLKDTAGEIVSSSP